MTSPFRTVLIGFGKMGAGFGRDPVMARHFQYASHAQVLASHPLFSWEAVVDPSEKALAVAREEYHVPVVAHNVEELRRLYDPEVAVLATPPRGRLELLSRLPSLKGLVVEKPLGTSLAEGRELVDFCKQRGIAVQVNFWRRGDEFYRDLASHALKDLVGQPYAVFGVYGNGLRNNGSHVIDFVRMLFGEIRSAEVLSPETSFVEGPIAEDRNLHFLLALESGVNALFQAIPFKSYREIGLDIWGDKGRLSLMQESLGIYLYPRVQNRAIQDEWEVASDQPRVFAPTCGNALYRMYDNLAAVLTSGASLWSPGEEALKVEGIVEDLLTTRSGRS